MDRIRDYLRGFCVLLSDMAVVCLIFYMVPTFTKIQTVSIPVFVWVLIILMQMLADYIMTGMGISFNLYLIGNAAALLAGTYFIVNGSYCFLLFYPAEQWRWEYMERRRPGGFRLPTAY